jgi:hypothetical protein
MTAAKASDSQPASRMNERPAARQTSESIIAVLIAVAATTMLAVMGRAVAGLVAALIVAYLLGLRPIRVEHLRELMPVYVTAIGAQVVHLIEEYRTGFHRDFPPVFGQPPWSSERFLLFNLAWLIVFGLAGIGLVRGWRLAVVAALFLALGGGILNGMAHAALAVRAGGYFPGLYTAPLVFGIGSYLAFRLLRRARVAPPAI